MGRCGDCVLFASDDRPVHIHPSLVSNTSGRQRILARRHHAVEPFTGTWPSMNLASATLCGTTVLSAAAGEPSAVVMVVQHGTRGLLASLVGYAASGAVLGTFLMRGMVPLRILAILSNFLFAIYGYAEHIYPVLYLHIALLPINAHRLAASLDR